MSVSLVVPIGSPLQFVVVASNGFDGNNQPIPYTSFVPADQPVATVWAGQDQAPLFAPSAVWVNAPAGQVQIGITAAQTQSLTPGTYRVLVSVAVAASGGVQTPIASTSFRAIATPGAATPGSVYCVAGDLLDAIPWLDKVQDTAWTESGWLKHRVLARSWLDNLIVQSYGCGTGRAGLHSSAVMAWAGTGGNWLGGNPWLEGLLATGGLTGTGALIVTPQVVLVNAQYAAGRALMGTAGANGKTSDYYALGAALMAEASARASMMVVQIDTNADGQPDIPIPLSITNTRYA